MTYDKEIKSATGNGKTVSVLEVISRTAGTMSFIGSVEYDGQAHLNFSERRTSKSAANRWFKCWSKLTA